MCGSTWRSAACSPTSLIAHLRAGRGIVIQGGEGANNTPVSAPLLSMDFAYVCLKNADSLLPKSGSGGEGVFCTLQARLMEAMVHPVPDLVSLGDSC